MRIRTFGPVVALSILVPAAAIRAGAAEAVPTLTVEQIVQLHVAAKGGLGPWRAVQSMSYTGKMEAGGKKNPLLPFLMELKRPHKTRVEIEFARDTALQVYDGTHGFRLRPFLGRKEIEPYTAEQLKSAAMESELDGFLVDYAAKGTKVTLEGTDRVEARPTYKLKLTLKGGEVRHLWIDTRTYLEAKIDGVPRRLDGKLRQVEIYYRDFRSVDGLMVPYVLETAVVGYKQRHKIIVDEVKVNPQLDDARFTRVDLDAAADTWKGAANSVAPRPTMTRTKSPAKS